VGRYDKHTCPGARVLWLYSRSLPSRRELLSNFFSQGAADYPKPSEALGKPVTFCAMSFFLGEYFFR